VYQRKYWDVTTLLKVTKARVCASMVLGRSCLERVTGIRRSESRSCGMKVRDSRARGVGDGTAERR